MRAWTEDEIQYVADNAGYLSNEEMGRVLKKSAEAIRLVRSRRKLGRYVDNVYTASTLAVELGFSRDTIIKWFKKGLLIGKYASYKLMWGTTPMVFKEQDVVAFIKSHPDKFIQRRVPNVYFRNVVRVAID